MCVKTIHVIILVTLIIYPNEKYWCVCREGNDFQIMGKETQGPGRKMRVLNYKLLKKGTTIVNSYFSRWSWNTTQAISTLHCTSTTPDKKRENIQRENRAAIRNLSRDKLKPTTFVN